MESGERDGEQKVRCVVPLAGRVKLEAPPTGGRREATRQRPRQPQRRGGAIKNKHPHRRREIGREQRQEATVIVRVEGEDVGEGGSAVDSRGKDARRYASIMAEGGVAIGRCARR